MAPIPSAKFTPEYDTEIKRIIRMSKKSQSQKFIDKAKELETDEDEQAFEDKLKRIVKQTPKKDKPAE